MEGAMEGNTRIQYSRADLEVSKRARMAEYQTYLCVEIRSMNRITHFPQTCAHCFCATQAAQGSRVFISKRG
jgi:hypothetical protein